MAYYYDVFYDKNYSDISYKIPYLGDLLEISGTYSNYEKHTEYIDNILTTIYNGGGTPTVPAGMNIIDFLKQFKKYFSLDQIINKYDGSSLIDGTTYTIP